MFCKNALCQFANFKCPPEFSLGNHINGLVLHCSNSIANTLSLQSCGKPWLCSCACEATMRNMGKRIIQIFNNYDIITTKQSSTQPGAYFMGYTVHELDDLTGYEV